MFDLLDIQLFDLFIVALCLLAKYLVSKVIRFIVKKIKARLKMKIDIYFDVKFNGLDPPLK